MFMVAGLDLAPSAALERETNDVTKTAHNKAVARTQQLVRMVEFFRGEVHKRRQMRRLVSDATGTQEFRWPVKNGSSRTPIDLQHPPQFG
jgi:hypothetical protein